VYFPAGREFMIERLAIIGVGLIGSSLALALKQAGQVKQVCGYGRNPENLKRAISLGVIDEACDSLKATVEGADMVVVAVPLGAMSSVFSEILPWLEPQAVVTDVGSAKASVVEAARHHLGQHFSRFVPGHPIAGAENSGVEAGLPELFKQRRVILTPVEETDKNAVERVADMWLSCGAQVEYLETFHHDRVLAATSHLPHMLAFALVTHLSGLNEHEEIFRYAAGGFRDFTRIASSDPVMWRDVCISNGDALVDLIENYKQELDLIVSAIKNDDGDQLLELFGKSKAERDSLVGSC
jgi:prephenate dehydrogenase